jgi:hypothetical protein
MRLRLLLLIRLLALVRRLSLAISLLLATGSGRRGWWRSPFLDLIQYTLHNLALA